MTIERVKPQGWSRKQILKSTEISQMDERIANALDKTGDTLTGTMVVSDTGAIQMQSGSDFIMEPGSNISINDSVVTIDLDAGSSLSNAGTTVLGDTTIGDLTLTSGPHVISGEVTMTLGTITMDSTAPLIAQSVVVDGAFAYTPQTITRNETSSPVHTGGFTADNGTVRRMLMPVATTQYLFHTLSLPHISTLTNVTAYIRGAQVSRTGSNVPSVLPKIELFRQLRSTGVSSLIASASDGSTLASAYESYHSISLTVSHLTSKTNYLYFIRVTPESGTNSAADCEYYGLSWSAEINTQDIAL